MAKRKQPPAGMAWLNPSLTVRDVEKALDFYQRAFGFKAKESMKGPDGKIMHAEMTYNDAVIMMGPEGAFGNPCKSPASSGVLPPITLYFYCEDVEALFKKATAAGAKVIMPPENMFWGDRMCRLSDPEGYYWGFATNVADFDPSKIPQ